MGIIEILSEEPEVPAWTEPHPASACSCNSVSARTLTSDTTVPARDRLVGASFTFVIDTVNDADTELPTVSHTVMEPGYDVTLSKSNSTPALVTSAFPVSEKYL